MKVRRRLAASVLAFESVVVLFGIAVAIQVYDVTPAVAAGGGLGLSLLCLLACGLLRFGWGFHLGTLVQVLVIASGIVVPPMVVIGVVFAATWGLALHLGRQAVAIERERGY